MAYKVVEHLINNTGITLETKEDFLNIAFFRNGDAWVSIWHTQVMTFAEAFLTESELDRLGDLLDSYDSRVSSSWDPQNQTYIKTEIWDTKEDFQFFKSITDQLYAKNREEQELYFSRSIVLEQEI